MTNTKRIKDLVAKLEVVAATLREISEEEQAAFDELSGSAREGTKGERLQSKIDSLEGAEASCREAIDALGELVD